MSDTENTHSTEANDMNTNPTDTNSPEYWTAFAADCRRIATEAMESGDIDGAFGAEQSARDADEIAANL